jgi:rod shape determining protein RodA
MPATGHDFGQGVPLGERLRIDFWLLLILLALCAYGLVVLYSASGRSIASRDRKLNKPDFGTF